MIGIRFTLLSDGASDRMLMRVISWSIRRHSVRIERESWADLGSLRKKPKGLKERAKKAVELYPCDILFVHRDAENALIEDRLKEIRSAMLEVSGRHIPVIPIRMTEAWFLHDAAAIRQASGNPHGRIELNLPRTTDVESIKDPKAHLFEALLTATEATGRYKTQRKRRLHQMRSRVAELIDDFTPLLEVPAFQRFYAELEVALEDLSRGQL